MSADFASGAAACQRICCEHREYALHKGREVACSKMTTAIKERSARNSESEMNGNRSVSLSRRGRVITSISAPMSPAFKPLPKFFLSIAFPLFLAPHAALRFYWLRFWNQALTLE